VSSWYRYLLCLDEDLVTRNPITAVHRPTVDAHHSATAGLTATQARALIAAAAADRQPAAVRTRAIVRLLLEVGLRMAEVCGPGPCGAALTVPVSRVALPVHAYQVPAREGMS
jgi:site-specific recombinase XerD